MIPARAAAAAARPGRRPARPAPAYDRYPSLSLSLSPSHGSPGPGRGPGSLSGCGIWLHLVTVTVAQARARSKILVHWQRSGSGLATKKQDLWPCLPPSLGFGSGPGGARSGGSESPGPAGSRSSSVVWSTASFPLTNPPTLFWLHYSAYFSSTYRRYLDRPTYGTEYQ